MEYLNKKILNKSEIARKAGMSPKLFDLKRCNVNYNKFNTEEKEKINQIIVDEINDMEQPIRSILLDFCESLGMAAINLLDLGEFEYVVDHYINNK